jgi:hypothetical protein
VVKSRASGKHYSSPENLPFVVGIDGVGRLDDGHRVHFVLPKAPFGSMSEQTVAASQCVALPDGLDDVIAAAIANPGMSAWAAFRERAKMAAGEIVLVNGATGTAGRFALQIAKHIGAKKVIATGRSMEALKALKTLEADVTIPLGSTDDEFEDDSTAELMLFWTISGEKARSGLSSRAQRQGRKSYRSVSSISVHIGPYRFREFPEHYIAECSASFLGNRTDGKRHRQHSHRPPCKIRRRLDASGCTCRVCLCNESIPALES